MNVLTRLSLNYDKLLEKARLNLDKDSMGVRQAILLAMM